MILMFMLVCVLLLVFGMYCLYRAHQCYTSAMKTLDRLVNDK